VRCIFKFQMENLVLRKLEVADCQIISDAFKAQGSNDKPIELYQKYLELQHQKKKDIIVATVDSEYAGYLTINWKSDYIPFIEKNIPEIVDFNVMKKFLRKGIGSRLMDEAELRISKVSSIAGIGFGVHKDYGPAQILYARRGYIPLGTGLIKDGNELDYGDKITIDHSLAIFLTKKLS